MSFPIHYRRHESRKKMDGPSVILRMSKNDHKDLHHLARRYTDGNMSEVVRVLIRKEMELEINRR